MRNAIMFIPLLLLLVTNKREHFFWFFIGKTIKDTQENLLQRAEECNHLDSSRKKIKKILFYKLLPQSEKTNLKRKHDKLQEQNESNDDYQIKKFKFQDQKNTNTIAVEEKKNLVQVNLSRQSQIPPNNYSIENNEEKSDVLCKILMSKMELIKEELLKKIHEIDGKIKQLENKLNGFKNKVDGLEKKFKSSKKKIKKTNGKRDRKKKNQESDEEENDEETGSEDSNDDQEENFFEEEVTRITRRRGEKN